MPLKPDQSIAVVFLRVPFENTVLVLPDASLNIACHPDVKIATSTSDDIGVINTFIHRASITALIPGPRYHRVSGPLNQSDGWPRFEPPEILAINYNLRSVQNHPDLKGQMLNIASRSSSKGNLRLRRSLRRVAHLLVGCALFSSAEFAQAAQESPGKVSDAVERVKQGNVGSGIVDASSYIEIVAYGGAVQAIPSLKEWFARSQDEEMKAELAFALVSLRDPDNRYWDFLLNLAKPASESDAPFPSGNSKEKPGLSPEFVAWAKAHQLSADEAATAVYELPLKLVPLAKTGDPRGIPLLRKALQSPNLMIQGVGANGLAKAQDKGAVALIIEACKKAPTDFAAHALADSLIYFDDSQAESEFHHYFPDVDIHKAKEFRGSNPWRRPSQTQ